MYLGTVFQTVLSLLYIIPRLRPGLLSLGTVFQTDKHATKQQDN